MPNTLCSESAKILKDVQKGRNAARLFWMNLLPEGLLLYWKHDLSARTLSLWRCLTQTFAQELKLLYIAGAAAAAMARPRPWCR